MFELNNNNDGENDSNNNNQIIGSVDWENERNKYKKELARFQQEAQNENFVLLKGMHCLRKVCREGKMTMDRVNDDRNRLRKLIENTKKQNASKRVSFDLAPPPTTSLLQPPPPPTALTSFGASQATLMSESLSGAQPTQAPPAKETGAVPKQRLHPIFYASSGPGTSPVPQGYVTTLIGGDEDSPSSRASTPKRKADTEFKSISPMSSSKKRKIVTEIDANVEKEKRKSAGEKTKRNRKLSYDVDSISPISLS